MLVDAVLMSLVSGSAYNVTVQSQPATSTCSVSSGNGIVNNDITNVVVNCSNNQYTIGGMVSGLSGTVQLQLNLGETLDISANGSFTFITTLEDGASYDVLISVQQTWTARQDRRQRR